MAVSRKNRKNMNKNMNKNRNNRDKKTRNKRLRKNTRNKRNRNKAKVSRKKRMRGGASKGQGPFNNTRRMVGVATAVHGNNLYPPLNKFNTLKPRDQLEIIKKITTHPNTGHAVYIGHIKKLLNPIFQGQTNNQTLRNLREHQDYNYYMGPNFKYSAGKNPALYTADLSTLVKKFFDKRLDGYPRKTKPVTPSSMSSQTSMSSQPSMKSPLKEPVITNVFPSITKNQLNEMRGNRGKLGTLGLGEIVGDHHGLTDETNLTKL